MNRYPVLLGFSGVMVLVLAGSAFPQEEKAVPAIPLRIAGEPAAPSPIHALEMKQIDGSTTRLDAVKCAAIAACCAYAACIACALAAIS